MIPKIEIVKFKDGKFGVRKITKIFFSTYTEFASGILLPPASYAWLSTEPYITKHCHLSRDQAEHLLHVALEELAMENAPDLGEAVI